MSLSRMFAPSSPTSPASVRARAPATANGTFGLFPGVCAGLLRLGELLELELRGLGELFLDDLVAEIDALVADVHAGAGDELLHLLLRLAAEGALQQVGVADPRPAPGPPVRASGR